VDRDLWGKPVYIPFISIAFYCSLCADDAHTVILAAGMRNLFCGGTDDAQNRDVRTVLCKFFKADGADGIACNNYHFNVALH